MRQSKGVEITCAYHVLETVKCAENKMTRLLVKCESRGRGIENGMLFLKVFFYGNWNGPTEREATDRT